MSVFRYSSDGTTQSVANKLKTKTLRFRQVNEQRSTVVKLRMCKRSCISVLEAAVLIERWDGIRRKSKMRRTKDLDKDEIGLCLENETWPSRIQPNLRA